MYSFPSSTVQAATVAGSVRYFLYAVTLILFKKLLFEHAFYYFGSRAYFFNREKVILFTV